MISRFFLFFTVLFCCTNKFYSQLGAAPAIATTNVTEASQYGVLYQLDLPVTSNYSSLASVLYSINNSSLTLNYNRVAYFLQVDSKWIWVSMNRFNTTNAELGMPYSNSNIVFQQIVNNMNVYSSPGAGVTNTTGASGNLEIWPDCYGQGNSLSGIGGNTSTYDFNDTRNAGTNCHGSFQVHNYGASQTLFAFNNFMGGTCALGIGTNTGNVNPDWTFMDNAGSYTTRKLWILVDKGFVIMNQPSTVAQNACINGTVSALTVSVAPSINTVSNYQWYSNTTAASSGGTLLATHTTTLTTDSYMPLTSAAGTLYYYCIANATNTLTGTSNTSGAITVGNPTLTITGTSSICAGESLTLSAASSISASTYTWSNGLHTNSIVVSPGANTNYSVSGTSTLGCIGLSSVVIVTVNTIPVISVTNGTICNGGSFVLSPSGASSYTYSGGSATVSPSATTNYTVSGTSIEGCIGSNTLVSVVVNTLPAVSIAGTNSICEGAATTLTASGAVTYTWSTNTNTSVISVSPSVTTSYSLFGTSAEGCVNTVPASATVTVNTLPVVTITGTNEICAGSSVSLTANGASTYTWNTIANTSVITETPAVNTTYSVSGTSPEGCVSAIQAITTVTVHSLPVVSITGTTAVCEGASVTFTANGASTYTWNTSSNSANITVAAITNTVYSVSGTSSVGCVGVPATLSLTVNSLPLVTITGSTSICAGVTASLTANGAATYSWSGVGTNTTIMVTPATNTTYSLTGTSSQGCAGVIAVADVTVNALPLVTITGTTAVCPATTTTLTAGGANTYTWVNIGTSTAIAATPTLATSYTVIGTNTLGCTNSAIQTITMNPVPTLTVSGPSGICTGQNATLTVAGASSYSWSTGSTSTLIIAAPITNTTYSVTGTNSFGCVKTNTQLVNVASSLSVSITGPTTSCSGEIINLGGLGGATYTWNTGATSTTITPNPTVTTTYSVTGASGTCSNTAVKTIVVNPNPTVSISGLSVICDGETATLTASGADTYSWSAASTATVLLVTPGITTTYSVTGSNTTGCLSGSTATVTVNALPLLTISGPTVLCAGSSATLIINGASTYTWSNAATTSSIVVNPSNGATYSVIGMDANGCTNSSSSSSITVNPVPVLSITSSSVAICAGDSVTLSASGAATYMWSTGAITSTVLVKPATTSNYTLTGTNTFTCSSSNVINITVNALPVIVISGPTVICAGESSLLNAGGASTYTWSTGSNGSTLNVTPTITTSYSILGTSTQGCIGSSASTQVNVSDCTGLSALDAGNAIRVYPNPNNGNFTIELEDATEAMIVIRNVLGQIVINKKAELITPLQLNEFNNGMYYLTITKNNAVIYSTSVIKN